MGSSCSSIRKKERQRSRRSSSDVGNPLEICGQRRCSERSADSLPYGAKASPPSVTRSHPPPVGAPTGEPSNGSQSGQSAAIQTTTSQAAKEKNHLKVEPTISQPTSPKPSPTNKSQESVIPHLSHYNEIVKGLLMGQIQKIASVDVKNLDLVSPKEIVIVLLSPVGKPSFLDNVVDKLKSTCAKKGYDLTLLNFDFGVEPFCLNDHNYRNLCFDILTSFRTSKQKVLHLVILATSDGLIPLPTSIEKKDFENLLEDFDAQSKEIFRKWYKLDESGKVDLFFLKKVAEVIKGFTSGDKNEQKDAIESWRKEYTVMVDALKSTTNDKLKTKYALPLFEDAIKHIVEGPQALQKQTFLVQLEVGEVLDGYSEAKITLDKLLPDSHKVYAASKDTQEINEDALRILNSNLQKMLEAMMDEESQEESLQLFTGLDYGIHVELLEQELARRRFASNQLNLESTLRLVSSYINSTTDHPLVVFGEMGSGRSSLAAKACLRFSSLFDAVLYRFVDVSEESRKHQQLLRSICEQMCFILGKHPSVASIVLNDDQEIIGNLFELTSEKPILIIVDGIDIAASQDTDALTWLTKKLPSTVKVIVTTTDNSRCLVYLKEHLTANAFARIQNPTSRELIDLIETQLRDHGKKLDDAQKEHVQNFLQKLPSPLYAHLLAMFILKFGIDDFTKIPENVDCLLAEAITLLKSSIGSTVVECAIAILTMLKHGITEGQVIDLMSSDQEVIDSVSNYGNTSSNIFPSWAWLCLKDKMSIFWTKRLVGRKQVIAWRSHYFSSAAKRLSLEETLESFSKKILFYIRDRPLIYVSSQVDKLSNRCKTEEIPFLNLSIDATTFKEKFIFNTEWLLFKVKTSDPFSLLEDINAYQLGCGDNDAEIHFFDRLIRKCAYPLRYDGSQILSQLFGRLHLQLTESKNEELASYTNIKCLYDASCQPDVASLLPLNTHFMANDIPSSFESLWYSNDTYEKSSTLYTIKGEAAHVISLSSDAGEIVVWNVHEQKPVRILKGINQPRDLKMIDKHRAIVLCNRELVVYNLNDGVMESKLKGVMNQKMPFFGLHDENYAVALSRNRMYVNMINLVTGDLETQFKVGEDRFLNSLLVSANGKICVCGDETQKPFPLLVWDLSNRKLLYDLRIPHHEFITRLAAISDDGHYVVSVCKELNTPSPNFIIVYDLQSGTLFKKWKPESNTRSIAISSQGGYVMNGIDNCRILVWDLSTGAKKYTLFGHVAPADVLQVSKSGKILMSIDTTCMDRSIRLWDLDTGVCLTVFTPDRSLSCCQLLPEGNIVVFSFKGAIKLNTLFLCHQNSIESHKIADQQSYGNPENDGLELNLSAS